MAALGGPRDSFWPFRWPIGPSFRRHSALPADTDFHSLRCALGFSVLSVSLLVRQGQRTANFPGHLPPATAYEVVCQALCPVLTVRG